MSITIGCDEVGRGPIAGPVVACAVRLNETEENSNYLRALGVNDSKKLKASKRKSILDRFNLKKTKANQVYTYRDEKIDFDFCITEISHSKIDEINILQASLLAMKESVIKLKPSNELILVDGNKVFDIENFNGEVNFLIKGDSKSVSIGLASIIAKEYRDELMGHLDKKYPGYNLSQHAGYPTKAHKEAVKELGPSPIHRKSFKGVKEYITD